MKIFSWVDFHLSNTQSWVRNSTPPKIKPGSDRAMHAISSFSNVRQLAIELLQKWWQALRLFSDEDTKCEANVEVIASNYLSPSAALLMNRGDSVDVNVIERKQVCRFFFPITGDKNISTCIDAVEGHEQLQGIFTSSTFSASHRLSIKVTLMNADDCNSLAWTWFVGSECNEGVHTECSST